MGDQMSRWADWRKCVGTTLAVLTLSAGVVVTSLAAAPAGAALASSGGPNTYKLSGAVKGTLSDGPNAGCPYGGINTKGFIDLNDLVGSVSGISGVASWSLDVNVKKNGTFKFKALPIGDPNAELNVNLKDGNIAKAVADNFFADAGSVTVKGESGSISATMRQNPSGKTLKLVARWACGSTAAAQAVAGSGWKTPVLVAHAAANTAAPNFTSVSCPTTSFCAAVDSKGSVSILQGSTWSSPQSIDSTATSNFNDAMGTVSCASASFCVAGDDLDDVYTYNGSSWSAAQQLNPSVTSPNVSFAVSCPTTSFCLAVDGNFNAYTYNGSTWSAAQVIDPNTLEGIIIGEVSCASATFCEAAFGQQTVTFNGSSWSAPVKIPVGSEGNASSTPSIEALSCASTTLCAGVGTTSNNQGYLDTFNGTAWAAPQIKKTGLGPQAFVSVSCPTTSFCMAPGLDGWVTYNGSSWGTPQTFSDPGGPIGEGPLYANSVSCTSAKFCEEVEDSGYADVWKG
jgi:hypothetical protein